MEQKICQSCGMPMVENNQFGRNKDQSINEDYCSYCFKDGDFSQDISMEEMINHCIKYLEEFNKDSGNNFTKEEAIKEMKMYFPKLKRWTNEN